MTGGTVQHVRFAAEPDVLEEALRRWVAASGLTMSGRTAASAVFWERLEDRPVPTSPRGIEALVGDRLTRMQVAYISDVLRDRPLMRRLRRLPDAARARRLMMRLTAGYVVSDDDLDREEPPGA